MQSLTLSPRSKTGSAMSKYIFPNDLMIPMSPDLVKSKIKEVLTKSAVDIPVGISTIRFDQALHNESDFSMV